MLLNGIQRLVDEVLSLKGHGFCLKIDKQVDQFLNPQETVPVEQIRHSVNDTTDTISETPVSTEEIPRDITLDRTIENNKDIPSSVVDTKEGNSSEPPKEQSVLDQISPDINNEKNEPNDVELQETEVEEVEMELGGNSNDMMVIEKNNEEKQIEQSLVTENSSKSNESLPQLEQRGESQVDSPDQEKKIVKVDAKVEEQKSDTESEKEKDEKKETEAISSENEDEVLEEKMETNTESESMNKVGSEDENEGSQTPVQDEKTVEDNVLDKNNQASNSYYTSLVTEPISDDSSSNSTPDSFEPISEEDEESRVSQPEEETDRRKSHRKRNVPLKYRDEDETEEKSVKGTDKKRPLLRKTRSRDTTKETYRDKSKDRSSSKSKERSHRKSEKSDNEKSRDRSRSKDRRNRKTEGGRSSGAVKRPATPPEPEERFSKRPRRPTKQRERYSPS